MYNSGHMSVKTWLENGVIKGCAPICHLLSIHIEILNNTYNKATQTKLTT